jgi:hypothetical protein
MNEQAKKPWEETWTAELHGNACECPSSIRSDYKSGDDGAIFWSNDGGRAYSQHGRLKLAAAAPDLARALLAVEWNLKAPRAA